MAQLSNKNNNDKQALLNSINYLTSDFYKLPAAFFRWREKNQDMKLSDPYSFGIIHK